MSPRTAVCRFACTALAMFSLLAPAKAAGMIRPADWDAYKAKFVDPSGRVVDDGNGGISHSEGQGYGLLLAFLADNRADFEQIWSFTRTELLLRDDGLAAWKWDPNAQPRVTDLNNASDGDILIAYALARAGAAWNREDLTEAASTIADAVGKEAVAEQQGRKLLMPAAAGFGPDDRKDGPVVNLSYWVFEAFPELARIAPDTDWKRIADDGRALIERARFSPRKLPPDWLSLKTRPRPADGFAEEFGYNALRIPLYLVRAGTDDPALLTALAAGMQGSDGNVHIVDLDTGADKTALAEAGYRAIPALVACVVDGKKMPADIATFKPSVYYPSTLHLLALAFAADKHPEYL
jgi:endoglucanase